MAFASRDIVEVLNRIKPPYNIGQATQDLTLKALEETDQVNAMIRAIVSMRETLARDLALLPVVIKVFPGDANFLLVRVVDPVAIYKYLLEKGIVVRDRSKVELCEGCLRITVGTEMENTELITALEKYSS